MSSKGWETHKLGHLLGEKGYVRGPFGSSLKRGEMKPSGIPVYEQQHAICNSRDFRFYINEDKFNELRRFQVKTNDLIVSCSGTIGKVSIIKEEDPKGIISQALLILRPDNTKVLPEYLKYYFSTRDGFNNLVSTSHGSVQINIAGREVVESIDIKVPNIPTQRYIVDMLSVLDGKIELNRQTNATLEAIAQAIFKEWFVDFNFPGATGEMVESELGMIPRGWRVEKLEDISNKITKGTTPTTLGDKFIDHGIRFLRAECIQDDFGIDESKSLFITSDAHDKLKRSKLAENDILITIAGSIGRIGIVTNRILPANLNQAIGIIRLDSQKIPVSYIYYYLKQQTTKNELLSGVTQSVQANISLSDLNNLKIMIPPNVLLEKFDSVARENRKYIDNFTEQSANISALRDSLLPKLMSGEIKA
jgi:type I restriction enzyme, S subunit